MAASCSHQCSTGEIISPGGHPTGSRASSGSAWGVERGTPCRWVGDPQVLTMVTHRTSPRNTQHLCSKCWGKRLEKCLHAEPSTAKEKSPGCCPGVKDALHTELRDHVRVLLRIELPGIVAKLRLLWPIFTAVSGPPASSEFLEEGAWSKPGGKQRGLRLLWACSRDPWFVMHSRWWTQATLKMIQQSCSQVK